MKKLNRIFAILLVVGLMGTFLGGCGSNAAEPYIGVWYGYKVSTSSGDIVFSDLATIVKMELTAEFTDDGEYELHYYVAGKEGEKYPQIGKYEMEDDRIILVDDDGYGEIINGELILYFENGAVQQHFRTDS